MKKLLLALPVLFLLSSCMHNNNTTQQNSAQTTITTKLSVKPPFGEKLNVPSQVYSVQPSEGRTIQLANGGSIVIPATAFVDQNGQPVTTPVEIRYREFHTPGEIIASGIPMKAIGPDGEEGQMQTAGMFDIEAFAGNQPVAIAPNKEITVNLQSHAAGKYDEWYFDREAGNWKDIGESDVKASNLVKAREGDGAVPASPAKPFLLDKSKPKLNFDVNYDRFPELKAMKGLVLQYTGSDPAQDPANNKWIFKESWEDAHLVAGSTPGNYLLSLSSDEHKYSIPVAPALTGQEYTVALRDYQTQLADYKKSLASVSDRALYQYQRQAILRTLKIGKLGIYNYDIFWKQQENVRVLANFDFDTEKIPESLQNDITVYLISKGGDMVIGYDKYAWPKFAFNPNIKDNKLLAILPGQKVAVISQEDFQKLIPELRQKSDQNYTFLMNVQPKAVSIPQDLDRVLASSF